MTLQSGEQLDGRYRIIRPVATGGTGTVYQAFDEKLRRSVALKIFASRFPSCVQEAEIAGSLTHPNIVAIYDFIESPEHAYLVMEYLEGETLAQVLERRRRMTIEEAVQIGVEIARALSYAHNRGIVHRDLNANNVMLGYGSRVKIMDFGMALRSGVPVDGTTELGALVCMAPERLMGRAGDSRCDQFGLGVLLYQMLSGQLPFQAENALALAYRILTASPPPLRSIRSDILERLEATVMRLLEKDPDQRFHDMDEVALHLERSRRSRRLPMYGPLKLPSVENMELFQEIHGHIQKACEAQRGVILALVGGISEDKFALLQQLQRDFTAQDVCVLRAGMEESAHRLPYYLWRRILRGFLGGNDLDRATRTFASYLQDPFYLPPLLHLAGFSLETQGAYHYLEMETFQLKQVLHEAFLQWLTQLSVEHPVLLILEELQWIDPDSLDLLCDAMALVSKHPVALVCSYRPDQESPCNLIEEVGRTQYASYFYALDIHRVVRRQDLRPVIHYHYSAIVDYQPGQSLNFRNLEWEFYENDGKIEIGRDGSLTLTAPRGEGGPYNFPFVCTAQNPFPEGDIAVRVEMQYLDSRQNGAGFEICHQAPRNQSDSTPDYQPIVRIWQDHSGACCLLCLCLGHIEFYLGRSPELERHRYEFHFLFREGDSGQIHLFVDDDRRLILPTNQLPRPTALWFGQFLPARTSLGWSDLRVYSVEVFPLQSTILPPRSY